ncbi:MAG TPA: aldehyde dehydrogenase family protein [Steroidobacteraceae bacterium]|nr:aldehyde dehydrogenase family protein [Steroidobacteraceae bacterium]
MQALANDLTTLGAASRAFLGASHQHFIDGRFVPGHSQESIPVVDPTSGLEVGSVPAGDATDIDRAVKAARRAFDSGPWHKMHGAQRERLLLRLADLLESHASEFSEIESVNSGRILPATKAFDVDLSVSYLRYMAGWATKITGQTIEPTVPYVPGGNFFGMTLREPIGVVGAITPWNVPLGQAIWKIAPALATGCTLVLKPAEQTPLTALRFAALIAEAGIPEGVINIVTGYGEAAGAALVAHPDVDKISFTGSTQVGRLIGEAAARQMKHFTLELGGKSPMVVLEDADLDVTIPGTAMGIFANHGQNCCAGSRLFVHDSLHEEVVAGIARIAGQIRLGPALSPQTEMGPLVSKSQQTRVMDYIRSGQQQGATVAAGGKALDGPGSYVSPTILTGVAPHMRVVQEEIFGPVLTVARFNDLTDVLRRANDTQFGLGASVWTRDLNKAHWFIRNFRAGTVWVNTHAVLDLAVPFGGTKQSGVGHELGEEAIRHHTHLKSVLISLRDVA